MLNIMYTCTYTCIQKLSPRFLWVSKVDVKLRVIVKNFKIKQEGDFSIFGSKSSHVQSVILKIKLGGVPDFWYFSFLNFRLGTYNVPSESSATSLKTSAMREFDGTDAMPGTGWTVIKSVLQFSSYFVGI